MGSLGLLIRPAEGQSVDFSELPPYPSLQHCVRCGRCLPACPTYQETALEIQSPRGRLSLIRALEEGKIGFDAEIEAHIYNCLDCRMCNSVCPANVPIGQMIVSTRAAFGEHNGRPWWRQLVFEHVLVSPERLGWAIAPMRLYQRLGLDRLAKPILRRLPGRLALLARLEGLLPRLPARPLHNRVAVVTPANGARTHRVGFFLGCMMSQLLAEESQATLDLLTRHGCEVVTPRGQSCCGAPQDDQGERKHVRDFAKRNIALFEAAGDLDAIVTDCAACSAMLKEYAHLLHDDREYCARAREFSSKVRDVFEWYDTIGVAGPAENEKPPVTVTIHDACHLANAQGIRLPQRRVLGRFPGIRVIEMADPSACCGSAGIYNVTHPDMSDKRLQRKLDNIRATRARVVVTNGPGCLMQLRSAVRDSALDVEVKHISQLLRDSQEGDTL